MFIASSGGHYKQLMNMKPIMKEYNTLIVTEHDKTQKKDKEVYYLHQVNRKELLFPVWMLIDVFKSIHIFNKFKPDVVVTTGVLATIPMCVIAKIKHKKLIYIESFAKLHSGTMSGKFVYKHHLADHFYVQWQSMLEVYPNAEYIGALY